MCDRCGGEVKGERLGRKEGRKGGRKQGRMEGKKRGWSKIKPERDKNRKRPNVTVIGSQL